MLGGSARTRLRLSHSEGHAGIARFNFSHDGVLPQGPIDSKSIPDNSAASWWARASKWTGQAMEGTRGSQNGLPMALQEQTSVMSQDTMMKSQKFQRLNCPIVTPFKSHVLSLALNRGKCSFKAPEWSPGRENRSPGFPWTFLTSGTGPASQKRQNIAQTPDQPLLAAAICNY